DADDEGGAGRGRTAGVAHGVVHRQASRDTRRASARPEDTHRGGTTTTAATRTPAKETTPPRTPLRMSRDVAACTMAATPAPTSSTARATRTRLTRTRSPDGPTGRSAASGETRVARTAGQRL